MIATVEQYQYREIEDYTLLDDFGCGVSCMDTDLHSDVVREEIKTNHYISYGAFDSLGHLVAFFAVGQDKYEEEGFAFEIAYLAVRKDMQRKGIGKACIREIVKMARENEYKIVTVSALSITSSSEKYEAVSFYRRCGFRQLELQQKGMTVVPMWRPID
jgi:ribosomal protein S18 acetylase RimI-like enzyme